MKRKGISHSTIGSEEAPLPSERRRALDPFFVFTYTLLALAAVIQVFLMFWMDFL